MEADLILQVVDYSDENYQKHMDATLDTLKKLEAGHIPMLYVMNKCDKVLPLEELPKLRGEKLYISVKEKLGIKELVEKISQVLSAGLKQVDILLPYTASAYESRIRSEGKLLSLSYEEDGILISAKVPAALEAQLAIYKLTE